MKKNALKVGNCQTKETGSLYYCLCFHMFEIFTIKKLKRK